MSKLFVTSILFFFVAASVCHAADDPFAFPRKGLEKLSIESSAGILKTPFSTPLPAPQSFVKISPESRKTEFLALIKLTTNETDYKFSRIKNDLELEIQYTLRIMDPENQTVQRQYALLMERMSAKRK